MGHDVAGLDLGELAVPLAAGWAHDAAGVGQLVRGDEVDLGVLDVDPPLEADGLPVDDVVPLDAGQPVVDAVALLAGDGAVRVADTDVRVLPAVAEFRPERWATPPRCRPRAAGRG